MVDIKQIVLTFCEKNRIRYQRLLLERVLKTPVKQNFRQVWW